MNYLNVTTPEYMRASSFADVTNSAARGAAIGASINGAVGGLAGGALAGAFGLPPQLGSSLGQAAGSIVGSIRGAEIGAIKGMMNRYVKDGQNKMSVIDRSTIASANLNYAGQEQKQVKKYTFNGNVLAEKGLNVSNSKIVNVEKNEIVLRANPENPNEVKVVADFINGKNHANRGEMYIAQAGDIIFPKNKRKDLQAILDNNGYVIDVPLFEVMRAKLPSDVPNTNAKYGAGVDAILPVISSLASNPQVAGKLSELGGNMLSAGGKGGMIDIGNILGNLLTAKSEKENKRLAKLEYYINPDTVQQYKKGTKSVVVKDEGGEPIIDPRQKFRYDYFKKYGRLPELNKKPTKLNGRLIVPEFDYNTIPNRLYNEDKETGKITYNDTTTSPQETSYKNETKVEYSKGYIIKGDKTEKTPFDRNSIIPQIRGNVSPLNVPKLPVPDFTITPKDVKKTLGKVKGVDAGALKDVAGAINSGLIGLSALKAKAEVRQPTTVQLDRMGYSDKSDYARSQVLNSEYAANQQVGNNSAGSSSIALGNMAQIRNMSMQQIYGINANELNRMDAVNAANVQTVNQERQLNAQYADANITANEQNRAAAKSIQQQGLAQIQNAFAQSLENSDVRQKDDKLFAENKRVNDLKLQAEQNMADMQVNTFMTMLSSNPQVKAMYQNDPIKRASLLPYFNNDKNKLDAWFSSNSTVPAVKKAKAPTPVIPLSGSRFQPTTIPVAPAFSGIPVVKGIGNYGVPEKPGLKQVPFKYETSVPSGLGNSNYKPPFGANLLDFSNNRLTN